MSKRLPGRLSAAFFCTSNTELTSSIPRACDRKVAHTRHTVKKKGRNATLLPGVVNGERVLIAKPTPELERSVEIRIRIALSTYGCLVWKHTVEPCWQCGKKPTKRTGLGEGATDLLVLCKRTGRAIFIEVKRPGYSPSDVRPMQRVFLATTRRFGGISGIATCEAEALALVDEARRK